MKKLRHKALSISLLMLTSLAVHAQNINLEEPLPEQQAQAIMDINASLLRNSDNIWQRIREGVQMSEVNSSIIRRDEQEFIANPAGLRRSLDRSRKYLFYIMGEVERRGMPTEIALLPIIESSYIPGANSPVGASGLWQFMPATGRHYGLEQTWWYDGRRDVIASTNAALDYLENLHAMFGDWSLALAGYNWGEGNVSKAMQHAQAAGLAPTYENIHMPNETRSYVPKLLAVRNVLLDPTKFGLNLSKLQNKPYFKAITVKRHIDIDLAAKLAGVSVEEFKQLNPAFKLPVFAYKSGRKMLVPVNRVAKFERNLSQWGNKPLMNWTVYMPNSRSSIGEIASKYNMNEDQLKLVNHISGNTLHAGRPVLVALNKKNQSITNDNNLIEATTYSPSKSDLGFIAVNNKKQKNNAINKQVAKVDSKLDMPTPSEITERNIAKNNETQQNDVIALFAKNYGSDINIEKVKNTSQANIEKVSIVNSSTVENAPIPTTTQHKIINTYTIRSGDTLYKIAKKYSISMSNLMSINHLKDSTARIGITLLVKNTKITSKAHSQTHLTRTSVEYIVKKGDTAYGIARKLGINYTDLKLPSGEHLMPGQRIKIQKL